MVLEYVYPYQKTEIWCVSFILHKTQLKIDQRPKCKTTVNLFKENIREVFQNTGIGNMFYMCQSTRKHKQK